MATQSKYNMRVILIFLIFITGTVEAKAVPVVPTYTKTADIGDCARSCAKDLNCLYFDYGAIPKISTDVLCGRLIRPQNSTTLSSVGPADVSLNGTSAFYNGQQVKANNIQVSGSGCQSFIYVRIGRSMSFSTPVQFPASNRCSVFFVADSNASLVLSVRLMCTHPCACTDTLRIHNVRHSEANQSKTVSACLDADSIQSEIVVSSATGAHMTLDLLRQAMSTATYNVTAWSFVQTWASVPAITTLAKTNNSHIPQPQCYRREGYVPSCPDTTTQEVTTTETTTLNNTTKGFTTSTTPVVTVTDPHVNFTSLWIRTSNSISSNFGDTYNNSNGGTRNSSWSTSNNISDIHSQINDTHSNSNISDNLKNSKINDIYSNSNISDIHSNNSKSNIHSNNNITYIYSNNNRSNIHSNNNTNDVICNTNNKTHNDNGNSTNHTSIDSFNGNNFTTDASLNVTYGDTTTTTSTNILGAAEAKKSSADDKTALIAGVTCGVGLAVLLLSLTSIVYRLYRKNRIKPGETESDTKTCEKHSTGSQSLTRNTSAV